MYDCAFATCRSLKNVSIGNCAIITNYCFAQCEELREVTLRQKGTYGELTLYPGAFGSCYRLSKITLDLSFVCSLATYSQLYDTPFKSTPIEGYTVYSQVGGIYVRPSLLSAYKNDSYWGKFSSIIKQIT